MTAPESMVISYTTTPEDYLLFSKHHTKQSKIHQSQRLFSWVALPSLIAFSALIQCISAQQVTNQAAFLFFLALLTAVAYPIAYEAWLDSYLKGYIKQNDLKGIIGQITLTITEETIHEKTETTDSRVIWKDVHRIEEVSDYLFIYVTSLLAAIIPKRTFSPEEYEQLRTLVNQYFSDSRG